MLGLGALTKRLFGGSNEKLLRPKFERVRRINALEPAIEKLDDAALKAKTAEFREKVARGVRLDDLLDEAFAVVREAARRTLGQRHFDVQLVGGMVLHEGKIAEMKTGEGKTLVATLPVYLNALEGKGVHVVTVNDYLARRDAAWMGRIYNFLGLSVGCIVHGLSDEARRKQYACDITYGTNNEYGFDYLRDNMKYTLAEMVQRGHHFAIVDEVDSILIDEARTPLIISGPTEDLSNMYKRIDAVVPRLEPQHYELDEKQRSVHLTEDGNERVEELLREAEILTEGSLYDIANISIVHHVNQALKAHTLFQKDRDYIVKDNKVVIIDEFTGRMMEGRRYSDGLHQALEAKENAAIQPENVTLASITFQNYFRLYGKLAGMTGTAATEAAEFADIYKLDVTEIPTNVPVARIDHDDEVYRSAEEKFEAIVTLIADCRRRGQPVLVGTVSIEKSELLSNLLRDRDYVKKLGATLLARAEKSPKGTPDALKTYWRENGEYLQKLTKGTLGAPIPHQVLNARYHEQEAAIVAQAGVPGSVTIATNMAGRGTDIQLGGNADMRIALETAGMPEGLEQEAKAAAIRAEVQMNKAKVIEAGGLYVMGTERHESRRIDNQLRGRSGRQGDPGASKFFLSLEDDLMRIFGAGRLDGILQRLGLEKGEAIIHSWVNAALERAQKKVEARNFDIRKNLLKFDNVMNDQRKAMFEQRIELMRTADLSEMVADMRAQVIDDLVAKHLPPNLYAEQWDLAGLAPEMTRLLGLDVPVTEWAKEEGIASDDVADRLKQAADLRAAERAAQMGPDVTRQIEKALLIQTLDHNWREHLVMLDHLRQHVGLRGYAQRDPLNEYKSEAFTLFEGLLGRLRQEVTRQLMTLEFRIERPPALEQTKLPPMQAHHLDPVTGEDEMALAEAPPPAAPRGPVRNRPAVGGRPLPASPDDPSSWGKVGRNDACPCGSGKKFKHCHGALV